MMQAALESRSPELMTPMFDRLAKSTLKAAVLLAALRLEGEVMVQVTDLNKAIMYCEQWREYTMDVLTNIGRTTSERMVSTVLSYIVRKQGVMRSELMQIYHLDARQAELILTTLEQRGQVSRVKSGRSERLYPIEVRSPV
jgi:ribosomal protein S25